MGSPSARGAAEAFVMHPSAWQAKVLIRSAGSLNRKYKEKPAAVLGVVISLATSESHLGAFLQAPRLQGNASVAVRRGPLSEPVVNEKSAPNCGGGIITNLVIKHSLCVPLSRLVETPECSL